MIEAGTVSKSYPLQLISNELMGVNGDLSRLDDRIRGLRYEADQLEKSLRPTLVQRRDALQQEYNQYIEHYAPKEDGND